MPQEIQKDKEDKKKKRSRSAGYSEREHATHTKRSISDSRLHRCYREISLSYDSPKRPRSPSGVHSPNIGRLPIFEYCPKREISPSPTEEYRSKREISTSLTEEYHSKFEERSTSSERGVSPRSDPRDRRKPRRDRSSPSSRSLGNEIYEYNDYVYNTSNGYSVDENESMPVYKKFWPMEPMQHHEVRKVTRKPRFLVPVTVLCRAMKQLINNSLTQFDDEQSKIFLNILRATLKNRIKSMLVSVKDYKGYKEILQMYRSQYPESSNEALIKEVVEIVKSGAIAIRHKDQDLGAGDTCTNGEDTNDAVVIVKHENHGHGDGFHAGDPFTNGVNTDGTS